MLHVATARGVLAWKDWRNAYESVMSRSADGLGVSAVHGARTLDNLAHIELTRENHDFKVAVAPAVLAMLPRSGLPIGVICGGRSPQTERKLFEAATANSALLKTVALTAGRNFAPRALFLESEDISNLRSTAHAVGIQFSPKPPAWLLAQGSADIDSYLSARSWRHEPEPALSSSEFALTSMRFESQCKRQQSGLRLLRYFPRRLPSYVELRDGECATRTDRDWGVYAVLRAHGQNCLVHDIRGKVVAVPAAAPLPRLLGRALALCSGLPPAWLSARDVQWRFPEQNGYHIYTGIPSSVAEIVFLKLGQSPLPLHIPDDFLRTSTSPRAL